MHHSIKKWYIKVCRYLFGQQFMKIMDGPLQGYRWTTNSSYEYIMGCYENPVALDQLDRWLKPQSVFYDLGANIGFHALLANRVITKGKIYSFEPLPLNRIVFEKHIQLNKDLMGVNNISLLPFAISDKEKEIIFSDDKNQKDGNTYITSSPVFAAAQNTITAKCYSIDELMQQGYEKPDIMKIDVEGAEYDVLLGAVNTLKQYKPGILLATHDCHLPGVKDNCIQLLQALGYVLQHTGNYNQQLKGLDDYIAVHPGRV